MAFNFQIITAMLIQLINILKNVLFFNKMNKLLFIFLNSEILIHLCCYFKFLYHSSTPIYNSLFYFLNGRLE